MMTRRLPPGGAGLFQRALRSARRVGLALVALLLFAPPPAGPGRAALAADLDGVAMPPVLSVAGHTLRLNGVGLRTYSIFRIHIYVAGLYLEQPSNDSEAILRSGQVKLLLIRFVHDVSEEQSRKAWSEALEENCVPPCHLRPEDQVKFLSLVPPFHRGDESVLLFSENTARISINGRDVGTVADPNFARTLLANFIGPYPPTQAVRRGLLGIPD
jgi:long-chain acyl-CoA synthetase